MQSHQPEPRPSQVASTSGITISILVSVICFVLLSFLGFQIFYHRTMTSKLSDLIPGADGFIIAKTPGPGFENSIFAGPKKNTATVNDTLFQPFVLSVIELIDGYNERHYPKIDKIYFYNNDSMFIFCISEIDSIPGRKKHIHDFEQYKPYFIKINRPFNLNIGKTF